MKLDFYNNSTPNKKWGKPISITRIIILMLFVSLSQLYAENPKTKNLNLKASNITLPELFKTIEKQSGLLFFYIDSDVTGIVVQVNVKNKPVKEIMDLVLKNTTLTYKIDGLHVTISKKSISNNDTGIKFRKINISGSVLDEKNEPIIGANILVKGTKDGTITDVNGRFAINISSDGIFDISFLGYSTQTIKVANQSLFTIRLKESKQFLDEVVVTALGIKKAEKSLGYSIQQVDSKAFDKIKTDNPINQLNGKVAGLTINSRAGILEDPSVKLRGRAPIYVVNGTPVDNYRAISSDDIESVSVLKGAQAAILYGSKGTDGAILITTKSGGDNKDKVNVITNSSTMFSAGYLCVPKQQTVYGTGYYGSYSYKDGKGGGLQDGLWTWGPKLDQVDPTTESGYWETAQYNSPIDPNTGERIPTAWRSNKNNLKNFLQEGFLTDNNVSVSKKYKDGSMRISLNQMYRRGQTPNTNLKRFGLNMFGNYNLTDKLHVSANMLYSYLYSNNRPTSTYGNQHPYYNLVVYMGANNDVNDLKNYWEEGQEGYQQRNWNHIWFNNPWFVAYEYEHPFLEPEFIGSLALDYDITKDLNFSVKGATNGKTTQEEVNEPYAWVNGVTGIYSLNSNKINTFNLDAMLTYNKKLGDFNVDGLLGGSWFEYAKDNITASTVGGLQLPDLYNLSNSVSPPTVSETKILKRTYGVYGSATFEYKKALYLTFAARNDWSSTLKKESRSYFYPSVSFSGIVSELIDMPEFLSFWKVRTSWAKIGRDMDPYNLTNAYSLGEYWSGNAAYKPGDILIGDVKPSFTSSFEVGTDLRFFKNRVRFDFSYFNTLDEGWIQKADVLSSSGYSKMLVNGNDYRRTGYELMVGLTPIETSDWKWDLNINWFTNKIILEKIYNGAYNYGSLTVGDRADAYYSRVWQRDPQGRFIVNSITGRPLEDPFVRCVGNTGADWEYGISSTLSYKKWSLTADISGRVGGIISSDLNARMIQSGTHMKTASINREEDFDQIPSYIPSDAIVVTGGEIIYNDNGKILSDTRTFESSTTPLYYKSWVDYLGYLGGPQTFGYSLYKADFVKLRSLVVTYNFSDLIKKQKIIKDLELSFIGNNLLIFKKLDNEDPDASFSESEAFSYPTERMFGFNLKMKF